MAAGVIGKGLFIKGELHGEEDLVIEGSVEGTITMQKSLTIETGGRIKADIETENLTINGEMHGNIVATESVSINTNAKVVGNVRAPRVIIEDGARFKGSVDMEVELPEGVRARAGAR